MAGYSILLLSLINNLSLAAETVQDSRDSKSKNTNLTISKT